MTNTNNLCFSYAPVLDEFFDDRKSTQQTKPGTFEIPTKFYKKFHDRNPVHILHGWEDLPFGGRMARSKQTFPYVKSFDIHVKICRADVERVKRLMNLIFGFEDNFCFMSPDYFPFLLRSAEYWKFMNWVVSQEILHSGQPVVEWKKFIQFVKWKVLQSKTPRPSGPINFPGFCHKTPERLTKFWLRMAPWLREPWYSGLNSKMEGTRFQHFITSRNMPAASRQERMRSLDEHFQVLTTPGPDRAPRKKWLYEAAYYYARSIAKDREKLTGAHLSVTQSASFETPIKEGGRGMEIASRFRNWLMEIPSETVNRMTWFGRPYWLIAGIPRWRTMCHTVLSPEGEPGYLGDVEELDFTPGKFRWVTPLTCLDGDTGYQLYQWAIEEAIQRGYFAGTPYRSEDTLRITDQLPRIKATAIGEPGNKSRVVTVGEGWLTIFLQPLSHALIGVLSRDPDARAGLGRAWQGFEFAKQWGFKPLPAPGPEERYILSSDLKTATDFCPHGYSKALLQGFTTGLGMNNHLVNLWIDLLTAPRAYVRGTEITKTQRGILMGDPGAKLVLSLFNKVAELEAQLCWIHHQRKLSSSTLVKMITGQQHRMPKWRCFAFAGDDHVAIGPEFYLSRITRAHIRNGMCVSETTNFVSKIGGIYCEELILIRPESAWEYWGSRKPIFTVPYESQPHVDAIKLRLLSVCRKEHEGKDETNPAIGMAATLRKMVAWFLDGWEATHPLFAARFRQRMRGLIPLNPVLACIPRTLGGIDAPGFDYTHDELIEAWNKIPKKHRQLITLIMRRDVNTDHGLRRILSQLGNESSIRGVNPECFDEDLRRTLSSEYAQPMKIDDFAEKFNMTLDEWKHLRFHERLKKIENETGYITIGNAINIVKRPYIFRDILFPEIVSQFEAENNLPVDHKRAYKKLHWNHRFKRLEEKLDAYLKEVEEAKVQFDSVTEEEISRAGEEITKLVGERDPPDFARDVTFIPRSVVETKELCTLRLPTLW
nr:RNA-dependent RNA polymerase [Narnavirus sp.]